MKIEKMEKYLKYLQALYKDAYYIARFKLQLYPPHFLSGKRGNLAIATSQFCNHNFKCH